MAKIDDVARLAGVSTATVSAVINGQNIVKAQTRIKVVKAIEKLNYHPNLYARSLARGRSALLGVIISDLNNPFFAEIAQAVQTEALARKYQVLISATQFSVDRLSDIVRHMIGMRVDGLVIMTSEMDEAIAESMRRKKIPVIFEDVGTVDKTTTNLRIDYEGGIFQAVNWLVGLGHQRILFAATHPDIVGPRKFLSHRLRAKAFRTAVHAFSNVHASWIDCPGAAFRAGVEGASEALKKHDFTAVVANADPVAFGLLRGFRNAGRKVPQDISIVGFDDNPACELTDPRLTSVAVSRQAIASSAVETLLGMIENDSPGREIHVPTELVIRDSAAAPSTPMQEPRSSNQTGDGGDHKRSSR
ncbi:MAG: LacI family DNA-binding transcriptional regulator [Bryobacteraceae bacterium]